MQVGRAATKPVCNAKACAGQPRVRGTKVRPYIISKPGRGERALRRKLDLGCGRNKAPGSIGVDSNPGATAADVIADLNHPLPFPDSSFDEVRAVHVIEHVNDIMKAVAEIHRVARSGGLVYLATPHYTDSNSWRDPTHRWHLNTYSFRLWAARGLHHKRHWYTRLELREVSLHVELARLWKYTGFQWLVNCSEWFRRFWEQYLCFIVRAKQMEFTFEVVKNEHEGVKHEKTHRDNSFVGRYAGIGVGTER